MADKKTDPNKELIEEALEQFTECDDYYEEEYSRGEADISFTMGMTQWDEDILKVRKGRPCLTENRCLPFVNKTVNEIRQARPSVIVKPVDSGADIETAEIFRGIIRNIETQSDAETAYDTAAYNAISSGYGFLRVNTKYVDNNSFAQEVCIERVLNPFSVYIDPSSQRMDGSDAEYAFVFDDMDKEEFEDKYPEATAEGFETGKGNEAWLSKEKIRIAEYYYKKYENKTLYQYHIDGVIDVGLELPDGATEIDSREVEIPSIKYCKITANEILEETDIVGQYIPIVPVYGMETWLDGKRQVFSLIHQAKDPQRMFNYYKSAAVETIALQPKVPFVAAEGQIHDGNADQWANANTSNQAVLTYKPVVIDGIPMPPPMRQPPPTNSGTMMQEAMAASDGIKASLGMYDASMGQQTNDISGKAIISRQMQGNLNTFHFVDNLSTAMKQVGRILVDIIPKVYTSPQIIRINGEDGVERSVAINQPATKGEGGNYAPMKQGGVQDAFYKLDTGKYDVVIEAGNSYETKRQETANALIELARVIPQLGEVAPDLLVSSLDIPKAEAIASRLKAQMPPELLGDDVEGKRLMQMAEENKMLAEKLQQTELALQVKEDNAQAKNLLETGKLNNEKMALEIQKAKTDAEIELMHAKARIEIPAEAKKDMADAMQAYVDAGAEMEQFMETMRIDIDNIKKGLPSVVEEVATGEPNKTPELDVTV